MRKENSMIWKNQNPHLISLYSVVVCYFIFGGKSNPSQNRRSGSQRNAFPLSCPSFPLLFVVGRGGGRPRRGPRAIKKGVVGVVLLRAMYGLGSGVRCWGERGAHHMCGCGDVVVYFYFLYSNIYSCILLLWGFVVCVCVCVFCVVVVGGDV